MRSVVRLWKPVLGCGLVMVVTGSLTATAAALGLGLLATLVGPVERGVHRVIRWVGTTIFVVGAALVVVATRIISPPRSNGDWQPAPPRDVSRSSYAHVPRKQSISGVVRSTSILFFVLAALDVAVGSVIAHPPLIPTNERIESAPSVEPGDIEYQVQLDGEELFLSPTEGPRWYQNTVRSQTTNWEDATGRKTYTPSKTSVSPRRIAIIGGSSAFGLGQSDYETIASELARTLPSVGQDAEIMNFGVPAYTTFQAVRDIENRIERGLQVDEVVAYTGFNDVALGFYGRRVPQTLLDGAEAPPRSPLAWYANHSAVARLLGHQPSRRKPIVWRVLNTNFDGTWELSTRTGVEASRDALYNLEQGYEALQSLSRDHSVRVTFVYQPTWFEASLAAIDTGLVAMDDLSRELVGGRWGAVRTQFLKDHPDAIDAARFVDGEPCWLDYSHTRGICSSAIARQIVKHPVWRTNSTEAMR